MTLSVAPLHIGALRIDFPVILAPMAGYTDAVFRAICRAHGAGLVVTEMVNAMGLSLQQPRTLHLLETVPGETPVGAHIYGSNPEIMASAAAHVESLGRFDLVDINAGCPVPKIMRRGDGAGLLKNPARLAEVVRAIRQAVRLPVTVKTRLGLSPATFNILEVARAVEEAGADALFLHARFASVRHAGPANWEALKAVKQAVRIPVIGNGGLASVADVRRMFEETGVDGVMIGRAAIGNPWLFEEMRERLAGRPHEPPTPAQRAAVIRKHLEGLIPLVAMESKYRRRFRQTPEAAACTVFRAHAIRYARGFAGFRDFARKLSQLNTPESLLEAMEKVLSSEWRRPPPRVDPEGKT